MNPIPFLFLSRRMHTCVCMYGIVYVLCTYLHSQQDSLQAFFSTIAGLLSSRAVLQGMGVGDAASSATAAVLLTVFQESTGRLATILFAHRYGRAIEPECKFYRYLADIVNDSAMFLDILSPALPFYPKVLALCAAGILRALCGVSGGAAKAALSAHFARNGNLAELNAKDGSQETVISLVGMLAGSLFVHFVHSREAVMAWMVVLITLHLWTNYQAVSAVQLNTLNAQRLTIILDEFYCGSGAILRPNQVAAKENILNWVGPAIHFADCLPECSEVEGVNLEDFVDVGYVIVDGKKGKKIFLKDRPYHPAFLLLGDPLDPVIAWIEAYAGVRLSEENDMWQRLLDAGWKLHTSSLETGPAIRVIFNDSKNNPV